MKKIFSFLLISLVSLNLFAGSFWVSPSGFIAEHGSYNWGLIQTSTKLYLSSSYNEPVNVIKPINLTPLDMHKAKIKKIAAYVNNTKNSPLYIGLIAVSFNKKTGQHEREFIAGGYATPGLNATQINIPLLKNHKININKYHYSLVLFFENGGENTDLSFNGMKIFYKPNKNYDSPFS